MKIKDIHEQLMEVLFAISRSMREKMTFAGETSSLTLQQIQALRFVAKGDGVTMGDIASYFSITLPTATFLTDKLCKENYIKRIADKHDRRVVRIILTKTGKNVIDKAIEVRNKKITKILSYLSCEEKKHLLQILTSLKEKLEETIK